MPLAYELFDLAPQMRASYQPGLQRWLQLTPAHLAQAALEEVCHGLTLWNGVDWAFAGCCNCLLRFTSDLAIDLAPSVLMIIIVMRLV